MPMHPGSSNWHSQMPAYMPTPNWQPPIPSHPGDAGFQNLSTGKLKYLRFHFYNSNHHESPYTPLPATIELPKKRDGRTKKNSKNDNLSPLNLRKAFAHDNVGGDDVLITGIHDTDSNGSNPKNNRSLIQIDPHIIGMLDGSTHPYPSWKNINWVYMPINASGNHWVTGAVNLPHSVFMSLTLWKVRVEVVPRQSERYWKNIRYEMGKLFYKCRYEDTRNCGYD
ncbi:hypothetical protein Tco_0547959 [Tanacetum coccineum]